MSVTSRGVVTVPVEILRYVKLKKSRKLMLELHPDGALEIRVPPRNAQFLNGTLK